MKHPFTAPLRGLVLCLGLSLTSPVSGCGGDPDPVGSSAADAAFDAELDAGNRATDTGSIATDTAPADGGCTSDQQCRTKADTVCSYGACNQALGACIVVDALDGTPCVDGDPCTAESACQAGACEGLGTTLCQCQADSDCVALADGTARCWGVGSAGRLGTGNTFNQLVPTPVKGLTGVVGVAAGDSHTCALRKDGSIWCWGSNSAGQIGVKAGGSYSTPRLIPASKAQ